MLLPKGWKLTKVSLLVSISMKNIQQLGLKIAHCWLPLLCPMKTLQNLTMGIETHRKNFVRTKEMDILNSFISNNRYLICN